MTRPVSDDFLGLQTALAGRYSLERELGRGGMGVVYLAHEVALDRPVALKLLPSELEADGSVRARFLQEARTAAKLSHPHIVPIFTVDEVDEYVFYAMALVDGETLGDRVRSRGPLSDSEAHRLMTELAWALGYAHAQGVVHRDVKPDNVLIENGTGRTLVMDFGIAQVTAGPDPVGGGVDGPVPDGLPPDRVQGTAEFMSPEQAKGARVDHRSDLYSLGAVGFYAVTGRAPFEGSSPATVLALHVTAPAPPVATIAPHAPTTLARCIDRCLRKEPDARFQDGAAIADALSAGLVTQRQLPVPLRVFIRHLREMSHGSPVVGIVVLLWLLPMLLGMVFVRGGALQPFLASLALVPAALGGVLAWRARKVLKAGHTIEDVRLALEQDVMQRNEEFRFDVGERETALDRLLKKVAVIGTGAGVGMFVLGTFTIQSLFFPLGSLGLMGGLLAAAIRGSRARRRADVVGERWLKFWKGRVGRWLFKLGGVGLERTDVITAGTYRPTEMAISISASRLFDELPKETRRELAGLPETVTRLEGDARTLRQHLAELNGVLSEIGDDPSAPGADARDRVRADVEATRDLAQKRLREVVTALETVRLGLLRMHAGERVVQGVTMELETARALSGDMSSLLEGHREVERLLAERRATGVFRMVDG